MGLAAQGVQLPEGELAPADRIVWATGFRRDLDWLAGLGMDEHGSPAHRGGLSTLLPGLAILGLPCMRTRRSSFLRGLSGDARAVVRKLS